MRYREVNQPVPKYFKAWMDNILPAIYLFTGNSDQETFLEAGWDAYKAVNHLLFIPHLLDDVKEYCATTPLSSPGPSHPLTPSHISVTSKEEDPNHPGEEWMRFNMSNTSHYCFVFANKEGRPELAKYIRYQTIGNKVIHQGTWGKNHPKYACPLHVQAFPTPNFYHAGIKDTDHGIFYPDCTSHVIVDEALQLLGDPGIVADVFRLCVTLRQTCQVQVIVLAIKVSCLRAMCVTYSEFSWAAWPTQVLRSSGLKARRER